MRLIVLLSFLAMSPLVVASDKNCSNYDQYKDVSTPEMNKIVEAKKATIVDVNSKKSYEQNHIPGAIHYGSNKDTLTKVLPNDKSQMIVAYCGGKLCTAWKRAAKSACELGYTNIRHFSEGIKGWRNKDKGKPNS